jgi:hypothetical protein
MRQPKLAHKTQTPLIVTQANRNDETLPFGICIFPKVISGSILKKGYNIPHFIIYLLTYVTYTV